MLCAGVGDDGPVRNEERKVSKVNKVSHVDKTQTGNKQGHQGSLQLVI
jgi:hypothetical protein